MCGFRNTFGDDNQKIKSNGNSRCKKRNAEADSSATLRNDKQKGGKGRDNCKNKQLQLQLQLQMQMQMRGFFAALRMTTFVEGEIVGGEEVRRGGDEMTTFEDLRIYVRVSP